MFKCRDISHLISQSMDRRLPWHIRMGIKFHLMMCKLCLRYQQQLKLIHLSFAELEKHHHSDTCHACLPEDVKNNIRKKLETP